MAKASDLNVDKYETAATLPRSLPGRTRDDRVATHKARSNWFRERTAWPLREASAARLARARRSSRRSLDSLEADSEWQPVGPTNIGGRMSCIAGDPQCPDGIWAGAAGGGVWSSKDGGETWRARWNKQDTLNVGSIAVDPNDPDTVYCGTGEANLSADSYSGVGLYKTTDAGRHWTHLANVERDGLPIRIGALTVDPDDSDHLWLGGVGHHFDAKVLGGLFESPDGGASWWRLEFISSGNYWCHDIQIAPTGDLYVAVSERGALNGVWKSTDGGRTWAHLKSGLPHPSTFGRISIAVAPSRARTVYIQIARRRPHDGLLGIFRSTNGGASWKPIHGSHFRGERQMNYNNTIAVHPQDPDHVLCGGVDLHLSTTAGRSWRRVTDWRTDRGKSNYAHADQHGLLFHRARPGRVYAVNDGGLDVSDDAGSTWTNRSAGLATNMFYDLEVSRSDPQFFGGGVQDNGTLITIAGPDDFFDITGGDGGWLVIDPDDPDHVYASIYNMNIFRLRRSGGWVDVSPPESEAVRARLWMVFIAMSPADPRVVFTGSNRVWRTNNDGDTWRPVSPALDGSAISAIEVSRADSDVLYVGTENGGVFASFDGGDSWSGDLQSAELPGRIVTRLRTRPDNAHDVFATVGNFGHPHLFRSRDAARSWEAVGVGWLPDVPHHAVAIPGAHPDELYLATDAGVFVSYDAGDTWLDLSGNLPNVSVVDIVYHDAGSTLTAATYGRSVWRRQVP